MYRLGINAGNKTTKMVLTYKDRIIFQRIIDSDSKSLEMIISILEDWKTMCGDKVLVGLTGPGAKRLSNLLGIKAVLEDTAILEAVRKLYPEVRTVISMGYRKSRCIRFKAGKKGLMIKESSQNSRCASGCGTFIEYLRINMGYTSIEELMDEAELYESIVLATRCAVFGWSDINHKRQDGTARGQLGASVCLAVSQQQWAGVCKSKLLEGPVLFIGGVSLNRIVVKYVKEIVEHTGELIVPQENQIMEAFGAAELANQSLSLDEIINRLGSETIEPLDYACVEPLRDDLVRRLQPTQHNIPKEIAIAGLAVDVGSVSTKAALTTFVQDEVTGENKLVVIAQHYGKTEGDTIQATMATLAEIDRQVKAKGIRIRMIVASTTGSGRFLTGYAIGADETIDEITAQAAGAAYCIPRELLEDINTIYEIGGQDSKYVRIDKFGNLLTSDMNKACAAGCGVFLESCARHLEVELRLLGPLAIRGKKVPRFDATCTVFTEEEVIALKQKGASNENLAAAISNAVVANYYTSNAADTTIGTVIFQGAVAKNEGVAAAFATALGREIIIPAEPELTGAIGASALALLRAKGTSKFIGFEAIAALKYKPSNFTCQKCPNNCEILAVEFEDMNKKFFSNDKCDIWSRKSQTKLGTELPDLFKQYADTLAEFSAMTPKPGAPRIGIPRAMSYHDTAPLYTFWDELGFDVVVSAKTNKAVVKKGQEACDADGTCLPIKVFMGQVKSLVQTGVDHLFIPRITSGIAVGDYPASQTCPWPQSTPDLVRASEFAQGINIIAPTLQFRNIKTDRGRRALKKALVDEAVKLGKTKQEARIAFAKAMQRFLIFKAKIRKDGDEILAGLDHNKVSIVVASRPYSLHDDVICMNIGHRIQALGVLAIPQDYLPLDTVPTNPDWNGIFSAQIQRQLNLATYIRNKPWLEVVKLTHFGCGPDSFGNIFFADELGRRFCTIQIDEHTAEAGVITRIESFLCSRRDKTDHQKRIRHYAKSTNVDLGNRIVMIPRPNDTSKFLAAAFNAAGMEARCLKRSSDTTLKRARQAIREFVCTPMLHVIEDAEEEISSPDFEANKTAFFMGDALGPCRFGMYQALLRSILDKAGRTEAEIITLGVVGQADKSLGLSFALTAWIALTVHDLLDKMRLHTRPYEQENGKTDELFEKLSDEFIANVLPGIHRKLDTHFLRNALHNGHLKEAKKFLKRATSEFEAMRIPNTKAKPIILLLGEFYVRLDERANNNLIRRLETLGFEVWLAPATEFFAYSNLIGGILAKKRLSNSGFDGDDYKEMAQKFARGWLISMQEHHLGHSCLPYLNGLLDAKTQEIIDLGGRVIGEDLGGEPICAVGAGIIMALRKMIQVAGIIYVGPQGCIPSMIVESVLEKMRIYIGEMPVICLYYNGFQTDDEEGNLEAYASRVRESQDSESE